jgi:hypothetical protein
VDLKWENLTAAAGGKIAGFVDYDWGNEACSKLGGDACKSLGIQDDTVFATMFEKAGDWDSSWDPDVHFVRSDDYFRSTKSKVRARARPPPAAEPAAGRAPAPRHSREAPAWRVLCLRDSPGALTVPPLPPPACPPPAGAVRQPV